MREVVARGLSESVDLAYCERFAGAATSDRSLDGSGSYEWAKVPHSKPRVEFLVLALKTHPAAHARLLERWGSYAAEGNIVLPEWNDK